MTDVESLDFLLASIVKEGWLSKRGEHIRTWRPRYFILFDDGSLVGFKTQPEKDKYGDPLNKFTVKGCQIMPASRPRPFSFTIRGLQWTTVIERIFATETESEREEWVQAIRDVASEINDLDNESNEEAPRKSEMGKLGTSNKAGRRKVTLEKYEFIKVLGKGTFGKVVLSRDKDTGKLYAMKILKKNLIIQNNELTQTRAENKVLKSTSHPFLTSLRDSFQTGNMICFVMEYVNGGDLFFHMKLAIRFSAERVRFYGAEIVSGLGYLHSEGIIYRDLKLENILLDKDGHIKIADFGLCKMNMRYGTTTKTLCGTPEYIAPEVLEDIDYGPAVDWWGLGVVMYEMVCGQLPFYNCDHDILFDLIVNEEVCFPQILAVPLRCLLTGLLTKDPTRRLGGGPDDAAEIIAHPYFSSINWVDLVAKKIPPPFKPEVSSELDTRYFDSEFTGESVEFTPPDQNGILNNIEEESFSQFSFQGANSANSLR